METRGLLNKLSLIAGAAVVSVMLINPAHASDRKVNSGTVCQANTGSQRGDFSYYSTGITNNAAATRSVSCPVVRDNTTNTDGVYYGQVWVTGTGTHHCYLDNVDNDGTLGTWGSASRSGNGAFNIYLATTTSQTPYVFQCSMPAYGKIVSLIVDEK
jgi:hypothetical protein